MSEIQYKEANIDKSSKGIFFIGNQVILSKTQNAFQLPVIETLERLELNILDLHHQDDLIGILSESQSKEKALENPEFTLCDIKKALLHLKTKEEQHLLLKSHHWFNWNKQSRFCGCCGKELETLIHSTEKKCLVCQQSFFPRFSPAVLVLISDGDKLLLARSSYFIPGNYSVIAGFVELGETAEQAAHREVREELGIEITDLKYFGTQTWPFPDSFMIAFTARYLSGELKIDPNEIEDARWFKKDELPNLVSSASIARILIDDWIEGCHASP